MALSNDLISQFAKITKSDKKTDSEKTVYGTVVEYDGSKYVKFDGSELLTPISSTTNIADGERVAVMIKNHSATVTGNITSPSARSSEVDDLGDEIGSKITEFEVVIADQITTINSITKNLQAETGRIDELYAKNVEIKGNLDANSATIKELEANDVTINGTLDAHKGYIEELEAENVEITGKLEAADADIKSLQADNVLVKQELTAAKANIGKLEADYVTVDKTLDAQKALIEDLEANKLSAKDIEGKYANIDFSNIGEAAITKIFADTGLIKNIVVGDGTITGNLVGVTISGDLIEGNTVKAEKLVVKGSDGLYYKLNIDAGATTSEQVSKEDLQNGLHGSAIIAKTITADRISVTDLVAFDATIGGFVIDDNSIHSSVKTTVNNTTRGIYMDNDGQFAIGDATNFIKYYKDTDGKYKLNVSASQIIFGGTQKTVEETIEEIREEMTTNLRIDSSRGTVFKNNAVSTVLSAVIYRGNQRITDMTTLRAAMGSGVYLQWKWQRLDEDTFGVISASDTRIGNDGFTLTLTADDVDTKVTFMCELIV